MQARKLILYGDLAKYFGKEHTIYVRNVEEAIRYLAVNFDKDFLKAFNAGYYYVRKVGKGIKRCLSERELKFSLGECDLHIMPVVKGAAMNQKKKGWVQVAVGTLLTVAGAVATAFGGGAFGVPMMSMGISMALGGIANLLTYVPPKKQDDDNSNSTAFAPQNVGTEGTTIPVIYGKVKVGSVVVSSGSFAERNYSAVSESSVITMLQRVIDSIDNEIVRSLAYALTITAPTTDELAMRGNYYYYPGRYPSIQADLIECSVRLANLEASVQASMNSLKESFSRIVADAAINQTLQVLNDCLGILRQCYTTVGETCDIDVEYTPTYVKKRGWAKALRALDKASLGALPWVSDKIANSAIGDALDKVLSTNPLYRFTKSNLYKETLGVLVAGGLGGPFASLHYWYSQRLNSLYRQSYSEDLYARTLSGSQSRRAADTFTPLDSCFFNISVLQYYLENYTLFGL